MASSGFVAIQDLSFCPCSEVQEGRQGCQCGGSLGIAGCSSDLAARKKTIDTLKATKNQTKTASLLRLSFSQIHGVMTRAVARGMAKRDPKKVYRHVCLDEKSVGRGQLYVGILYDGDTGAVIDATDGRKSDDTNTLCEKALTEDQRMQVETICTDMWEPFIKAAKKYFPNAKHCHDLYHCVTYLNEAVDKYRRWETKTNPMLKGSKWIWLKDQSNYTDKQQAMYNKLMACNLKIAKVWAVKEQFRTLIQQEYAGDMEAYLYFSMWFDDAIALKSSAMEAVAFTFKRHLKGIVRAMVTKANNGKAERMNGSIQEIRTIGRGYATAKRFRTAILFFYGDLDLY